MDKMLIFQVSATDAFSAPLSALQSIDMVDADTINFSFIGGGISDGNVKTSLVTCDITTGTYVATIKEISEFLYATGSMKLPFVDVAGVAAAAGTNISNITSCTAILITQ